MTNFGTWSNRDYGWDRTGHQPNEVLNDYIRHIWQPGLELTALMLDYYEHTLDEAFLADSSCCRWRTTCCGTSRRASRATRRASSSSSRRRRWRPTGTTS